MFNFRKIRKNVKAISPVISVLLMIAVAVVASLVAYAWVMGYMNFQTAKTGQAIQIQSIASYGNSTFTIYVQNVGDADVKLDSVYINGGQAATSSASLLKGDTTSILATANPALTVGVQDITFKVTTEGGTFSQITQQFTIKVVIA
jgi:flagellin-like protein